MVVKVNILAAIVLSFILVGCGGGETTTTGINGGGGGGSGSGGTGGGGTGGGGTGTASLSWMAPSTYTDNTAFTDLQGHNIYMDSGNGFIKIGTVNSAFDFTFQANNLPAGTYTFVVTAFDSLGVESSFSQPATISITS